MLVIGITINNNLFLFISNLINISLFFSINTIEISRDCSLVAAGCSDSSIKLWDINQTHTRNFGTIVTSTDENDGSIIEKKGNEDYHILCGHSGPVYSLSFSPDNKFLLSGSEDSTGN